MFSDLIEVMYAAAKELETSAVLLVEI